MPKSTFLNLPNGKQYKIIRDSIREFAQKGYDKGNIGEIAKNSNVAKGSMYQYFEDKRDLYVYSVKKALEISICDIQYVFDDLKHENIFDFIYRGFEAAWPLLEKERDVFVLLRNVNFEAELSVKNELMDIITRSSEEMFIKIIEDNKLRGFIRKDINNKLILIYIDGISYKLKSYMLELAVNKGKDILDTDFSENKKLIMDMIDLMKSGIIAKN